MSSKVLPPPLISHLDHTLRVLVTNIPQEHAPSLAKALVSEHVAACVNLVPGVQSFYFWEGEVVQDTECTLLIKTTDEALERCTQRLVELHPYTVPELLVMCPEQVLESYADWASEVTSSALDASSDAPEEER